MGRCAADAEYYASRGYVYVGQNVRGSYGSAGDYSWFRADAWGANQDGYDTVEWAAAQPWSNGKVGMVGGSYSGMTQYLTAPTAPPHLSALFVRYATANVHTLAFRAGAYKLRYTGIVLLHIFEDLLRTAPDTPENAAQQQRLTQAAADLALWQRHLPLQSLPPLEGTPYYHAMYTEPLAHPDDGPYWWPLNMTRHYAAVDVPILHLAGWFDGNLNAMLQNFMGIRAHGRSAQCRQGQRLVIGPWIHGKAAGRQAGDVDFGPDAEIDLDPFHLRWYDYWLKGMANGVMADPPVRIFLMGENRWLDLADWPPPGITYTPIYFRQGQGQLGNSLNDGQLTFDPPATAESADSFPYDPAEPIPSLVGYPDDGPSG
ncbi:MAG: CocE/NonD family hydrolase [Caldilinea sp. CFX5]|nr:CocE/NonD family hydrolase [Caldilinea sp. CFX5]